MLGDDLSFVLRRAGVVTFCHDCNNEDRGECMRAIKSIL